jgi:hypothetical protein
MVSLYGAIALLGVVFASVLQSTRALWSVLLGAWLGRGSDGTLETEHHAHVLGWRLVAAGCMVAAVALFGWSR